jgi:hypothetical protein
LLSDEWFSYSRCLLETKYLIPKLSYFKGYNSGSIKPKVLILVGAIGVPVQRILARFGPNSLKNTDARMGTVSPGTIFMRLFDPEKHKGKCFCPIPDVYFIWKSLIIKIIMY